MSDNKEDRSVQFSSGAERVVGVDPTAVWALVADPARVGEWAAVTIVGYMGTELPMAGQAVFVRTRRWQRSGSARRVEIESWEAGAGYRCAVESRLLRKPVGFEVTIKPEVSGGGIATRVRLTQRMTSSQPAARVLRRYVTGRLENMLDRIERAATR